MFTLVLGLCNNFFRSLKVLTLQFWWLFLNTNVLFEFIITWYKFFTRRQGYWHYKFAKLMDENPINCSSFTHSLFIVITLYQQQPIGLIQTQKLMFHWSATNRWLIDNRFSIIQHLRCPEFSLITDSAPFHWLASVCGIATWCYDFVGHSHRSKGCYLLIFKHKLQTSLVLILSF